jgi:acylphosphatase
MVRQLNIRVSGKVQGVFFRASTKEKADALGIHGFVRNERDGSVYIEAAGDERVLEQFVDWCRHGPPRAHVDRCEIYEGVLVETLTGFEVKRW